MKTGFLLALIILFLGLPEARAEQPSASVDEVMAAIKGAAPATVLDDATIMKVGPDKGMEIVKEGSNGWTCMGGPSPMCADEAAMEWVRALKAKSAPPKKVGVIYMLKGDAGASNTDPFATEKTADNYWVQTGPHMMVVGEVAGLTKGYPNDPKADPAKPFVMWRGTPYEHLMLPVP